MYVEVTSVLRIKIPEILYSKARKSLSSVCEFFGHRTTAYIYILMLTNSPLVDYFLIGHGLAYAPKNSRYAYEDHPLNLPHIHCPES